MGCLLALELRRRERGAPGGPDFKQCLIEAVRSIAGSACGQRQNIRAMQLLVIAADAAIWRQLKDRSACCVRQGSRGARRTSRWKTAKPAQTRRKRVRPGSFRRRQSAATGTPRDGPPGGDGAGRTRAAADGTRDTKARSGASASADARFLRATACGPMAGRKSARRSPPAAERGHRRRRGRRHRPGSACAVRDPPRAAPAAARRPAGLRRARSRHQQLPAAGRGARRGRASSASSTRFRASCGWARGLSASGRLAGAGDGPRRRGAEDLRRQAAQPLDPPRAADRHRGLPLGRQRRGVPRAGEGRDRA